MAVIRSNGSASTVFALFLALYGALGALVSTTGGMLFSSLHIALDACNAMLSGIFALSLWSTAYSRTKGAYRGHLTVAFAYVSASEAVHALIGAEWTGSLAWIRELSSILRPATWPPSTYFLPLAMLLVPPVVRSQVPLGKFGLALGVLLVALYAIFFSLPSYVDTGVAGIHRPFQIPVLPLLAAVIWVYGRERGRDPLFPPLIACSALLFLSDLSMLWSTSPHEKWAITAHLGKFCAYLLLHVSTLQAAIGDMVKRDQAEVALRQAKDQLEARVMERTAELWRTNKALQESQKRFAGIVESAMDAIVTIDEAQRIVLFNDAAQAMFRCPRAEALGSSIARFVPAEFRADHAGHVRNFGTAGVTSRMMTRLGLIRALRSDRQEFPAEASISQIEVDGQKLFTVILRDITERVRATEEIQRLNADLESRVRERTARLEVLNKELQAFSYAASHDLKAPLGRINAFSALLDKNYRQHLAGDGILFLDFIRNNAARLSALIEDMLAHARIEQQARNLQAVDVRAAVQAMLSEKHAEMPDGRVEIRIDLPEAKVAADPLVFTQVLRNLVDNAFKYSARAEPPRIDIGGRLLGGNCRLWVRDNGVGFDMAYHDQIFEIFRRLHTYDEFPGSGVGLALVKKAMEGMNGRVWAESRPGDGATFFLELPVAATEKDGRLPA